MCELGSAFTSTPWNPFCSTDREIIKAGIGIIHINFTRALMWLRPLPFLFSTLNEHSSSGTPHTPMRWHNGVIRGREFQSLSPSVIEIHEDYASYVGESRERIFALLQLLRDN